MCSIFSHLTFIPSHSGVFSPSWSLGTPAPLTLIFGRRHDPFIHSFIHLTLHPSRSSGHPQFFFWPATRPTHSFFHPPDTSPFTVLGSSPTCFGRRHDPLIHSSTHLSLHPSRSSGHPLSVCELSCSRRSSPFILISSLLQSLTSQSTTRKEYLLV